MPPQDNRSPKINSKLVSPLFEHFWISASATSPVATKTTAPTTPNQYKGQHNQPNKSLPTTTTISTISMNLNQRKDHGEKQQLRQHLRQHHRQSHRPHTEVPPTWSFHKSSKTHGRRRFVPYSVLRADTLRGQLVLLLVVLVVGMTSVVLLEMTRSVAAPRDDAAIPQALPLPPGNQRRN